MVHDRWTDWQTEGRRMDRRKKRRIEVSTLPKSYDFDQIWFSTTTIITVGNHWWNSKIKKMIKYVLSIKKSTQIKGHPSSSICKSLKILTPKQMLQILPIALAKINAQNRSDNLLNEIRQIVYPLYQAKEITKKVCNNIIKPNK